MKKILIGILIMSFIISACGAKTNNDNEINIYTDRHYEIDKQILNQFTEETGIKINIVELESQEVYSKLKSEGNVVADVVIMTGAEYIYQLNELDLLQDHNLEIENTDEMYYSTNWAGFAGRTRSIATSNNSNYSITSYDDLANKDLGKQILVRSSDNTYNQAWVSAMILANGQDDTKEWLNGFVNNFAKDPEGNDRDQVKNINAGKGDVAIVNSYYMHKLYTSTEDSEVEAATNVEMANLDSIFMNVSWVGLLNKNSATTELMNYLLSEEVQSTISQENGEYPLNDNATTNSYIKSIQDVNTMEIDYELLGSEMENSYQLMLEAGWK